MLAMKQQCEKCDVGLDMGRSAYICSYECTYCTKCAGQMKHRCPNCNGELVVRPKRLMRG